MDDEVRRLRHKAPLYQPFRKPSIFLIMALASSAMFVPAKLESTFSTGGKKNGQDEWDELRKEP